jgi:hypothetical protein
VKRGLLVALFVCSMAPGDARGATAAGGPRFPAEALDTAALVLRVSDLPPAYVVGDDSGCGIGTENAPAELAHVVVAHLPEECSIELENRRGSPYILSSALAFRTLEGASAMFAVRRQLLAYETGSTGLTEKPQGGVGEEARLFLVPDAYGPYGGDRPGAAVLWRRGAALGIVLVARPGKRAGIRMATRLAARQDARMQHPTPLRAADNDDLEVPIADPRVGVPVQWLGRRFARRGLAPLHLAYTFGPERPQEGLPMPRAQMEYEARKPRTYGVDLNLWQPAQWRRVDRGLPGPQLWRTPCARARFVRLRSGHAIVYSGHAKLSRSGRCPSRPHDSFAALAYFRRVVVAVNMPYCNGCADGVTGKTAPYNSVRGMLAVVRSLRLRGR